MKKRKLEKFLLFLCSITLMGSMLYLGVDYLRAVQGQKEYALLSRMVGESIPMAIPSSHGKGTTSTITQPAAKQHDFKEHSTPTPTPYVEPVVLEKYRTIYDMNNDLAGWLKIEGTIIDYPVVLRDNEYYLRRDFNGKDATAGCLFIDEKNTLIPKRSTNVMIYGHNMRAGTMFADLNKWREESFYKEHAFLQFDTIYEEAMYEIAVVFEGQVYKTTDKVYKFYQFVDAKTQEEFDMFVDAVKKNQMYETGVELEFGDELLTLITCSSHLEGKLGRLVVVAKKVK